MYKIPPDLPAQGKNKTHRIQGRTEKYELWVRRKSGGCYTGDAIQPIAYLKEEEA